MGKNNNKHITYIVKTKCSKFSVSLADRDQISPLESFCQGWQQAMRGETLPISQLWESIDKDEN